jgi:hypothetical protein
MKRAALATAAALLLAGCGGTSHKAGPPPTPRLPRALAHEWIREANAVAAALDARDGCTAEQHSAQLRSDVIDAVNAGRVPTRLLEPLTSAVNSLPGRITCTPPAPPAPATPAATHGVPKPKHEPHGPEQGHGHGHGKGHKK